MNAKHKGNVGKLAHSASVAGIGPRDRAAMVGILPATKSHNSTTTSCPLARSVGPRVSCQMKTARAPTRNSQGQRRKNRANRSLCFPIACFLIRYISHSGGSKILLTTTRNDINHYQITRRPRSKLQNCCAVMLRFSKS